jgi:hypothetical protein
MTLVITACGPGKDGKKPEPGSGDATAATPRDTPAAGKVGGHDFVAAGGYATPAADGRLTVELWSAPSSNPCDPFVPPPADGRYVAFAVPKATGAASPTLSLGVVVPGHTDIVVGGGRVVVAAVSDTAVSGSVDGEGDEANTLNGTFEVTYCAVRH